MAALARLSRCEAKKPAGQSPAAPGTPPPQAARARSPTDLEDGFLSVTPGAESFAGCRLFGLRPPTNIWKPWRRLIRVLL